MYLIQQNHHQLQHKDRIMKDSVGTTLGKLAVKGLKKLGVKSKKKGNQATKKPPIRVVGKEVGVLGTGAAQGAANKLKKHNSRTKAAIDTARGGRDKKEMKGRR